MQQPSTPDRYGPLPIETQDAILNLFTSIMQRSVTPENHLRYLQPIYSALHDRGYRVASRLAECIDSDVDLLIEGGYAQEKHRMEMRRLKNALDARVPDSDLKPLHDLAELVREHEGVVPTHLAYPLMADCIIVARDAARTALLKDHKV